MENLQTVQAPPVTAPVAPAINFKRLSRWRVRVTAVAVVVSIAWLIAVRHQPRDLAAYSDPIVVTSLVTLLLGVSIRSWAASLVRKRLVLATSGAYSLCRHPLYLGSILMVIGFCGLVGNPVVGVLMCGVVIATISVAIKAEEQFLSDSFGDAWDDYKHRVPRLVPCALPRSLGEITFQRWRENREARVWLAAALGLAAIAFWLHGPQL